MPAASVGTPLGRTLRRHVPILFKRCPAGLLHARWDRFCFCRAGEHVGGWHGGIYEFSSKTEVQYPVINIDEEVS
jgi:hypothetical protein